MVTLSRRRPVNIVVRGQPPAPLKNSVGQSFPPRGRWLRSDLSATASRSPGSFGVPAARGWTGFSRFRWKSSVGRSTPDLPGSEFRESQKTCGSSRKTESSRRWLAPIGLRDAKDCLPPPRPRGRMTLSRLGDGRPAAHRSPTTAAHEQNDAPEAATTSSQVERSLARPR
jgi:hypothetical protein